jgi:hypothetical protein
MKDITAGAGNMISFVIFFISFGCSYPRLSAFIPGQYPYALAESHQWKDAEKKSKSSKFIDNLRPVC